ncbi:FadR family transcriptional regulator [Siminovitchia acidinfaciens]|uniref:FadR family transcriptional regulator n=1 Tax=Siminovitchia acidinfaciens TaxID=2321395 RepID=A0A429Y6V2_9BACI|nr:FadR/GntR family transcriptional regulator [Siminovitchia acidinfaciens]RST77187.1 FadR family transcriptional regulator [Siminovitchia acidinfaciens]
MAFKNKKILTLSEQISEHIKEAIISGSLKKGDKLPPEQELADQFEVSRPTIRDAIKLLSASKLVTTRSGAKGGHFVSEISPDSFISDFSDYLSLSLGLKGVTFDELMEFRKIIEVQSCILASQRRTEEDLIKLKKILPEINTPLSDFEYFQQDFEFHRAIAAATHNPLFIITVESITNVLNLFRSLHLNESLKQNLAIELSDIYSAIEQQDKKMAQEKMYYHINHYENTLPTNAEKALQPLLLE